VRANEPGTPVWNEVVTPDIARATLFYKDVLGVDWEEMPTDGDGPYTCLMVDGRAVGGAMPPPMDGVPPHWNVYFNVEDVDATVERATGLGGSVVAPPFDVAGVGRMAVLADPQGGMFNLMAGPTG
jgi:predicted enzyme related to lactoylglutathione lyase